MTPRTIPADLLTTLGLVLQRGASMEIQQAPLPACENPQASCKPSELSQLSGISTRVLRRYHRIGLLDPRTNSDLGDRSYSRHDLIRLERLAIMQMLGLSRSEIRACLNREERDLREELLLQREILLEKRRRLNRVIYFMEYAEQVNRDPQSDDWHYLGKVIEAIQLLRDPGSFKRFYIGGAMHEDAASGVGLSAQ
jgi:DNA-binding transcriptional MerR regulator